MAKIKFLVIQHKMVGDVIASTLICDYLKHKYQNCEVHFLINSNTIPVVLNNPNVDKIIEYKAVYSESMKFMNSFIDFLRNEKYDVAIDAYGKLSSAIIAWRSRAQIRISFHKWYAKFLYTKTVTRRSTPQTIAATAIENRLLLVMKSSEVNSQVSIPKIYLRRTEIDGAKAWLSKQGLSNSPLVMLSMLGSADHNSYPAEYMVKIIEFLAEQTHANFILNYMPGQAEKVSQMAGPLSAEVKQRVYMEHHGNGLRFFLSILHECSALIGNEGGTSNMAKSLNIPSFSIFSPAVEKAGWMMFEDDIKHTSVHLKELKPDLYQNLSAKQIKKQLKTLYQLFEPKLIYPRLKKFCEINLSQSGLGFGHTKNWQSPQSNTIYTKHKLMQLS